MIIDTPEISAEEVNKILSEYANLIIGRMGIPYKKREVSVNSLMIEGTIDQIGAMTGKLGQIRNFSVKSLLTNRSYIDKDDNL